MAEEMTYPGFLQIARFHDPEFLIVPTDLKTGIDVDCVERQLSQGARPSFIYAITDGHNPLGVSMSASKRERLAELARRHRVPIVEEDPYGMLSYSSHPLPPMRAIEADWVFYVGSLSKVLAPGMRIGWIVAPDCVMPYLAILKESADIDMATFAQRVAVQLLNTGFLADHIDLLRREYGLRREAMLVSVAEHFPRGMRCVCPESGVFVWVELPSGFHTSRLLEIAVSRYGVAFIPGSAFSITGEAGGNSMRLNFSHPKVEDIREGVARLGAMLKDATRWDGADGA
jgi:2-aminoadipate transaminase